jgi:queuine tRNA-ribosyltransferase
MRKALDFKITNKLKGTFARAGVVNTPHGKIETPAFIVGGTKATVKALTPEQVKELGGQSVLVNTYHLMLRPGATTIKNAGGLDKFMNWHAPTFSDSGGFQVFSLGVAYKKGIDKVASSKNGEQKKTKMSNGQLAKITDDGVWFRSHIDGQKIFISPEISMDLQHDIRADIHFAFDECPAPLATKDYIKKAVDRTHKWAVRCLKQHQIKNSEHIKNNESQQALFGIVQGARHEDLRRLSARTIGSMDFDGFGLGGIFEPEEINQTVRWVVEELPEDKPKHLLGLGAQPADLFLGIEYGMDTFDCVAPTRQARNGALYTKKGRINIKNAQFTNDYNPVDDNCGCYSCQNYSKAYLNHLFRSDEILGATLASIHNEHFVVNTVKQIRDSIIGEYYFELKKEFLSQYYGKYYHLL